MTRSGIIKRKGLRRNKKVVMNAPDLMLAFKRYSACLQSVAGCCQKGKSVFLPNDPWLFGSISGRKMW